MVQAQLFILNYIKEIIGQVLELEPVDEIYVEQSYQDLQQKLIFLRLNLADQIKQKNELEKNLKNSSYSGEIGVLKTSKEEQIKALSKNLNAAEDTVKTFEINRTIYCILPRLNRYYPLEKSKGLFIQLGRDVRDVCNSRSQDLSEQVNFANSITDANKDQIDKCLEELHHKLEESKQLEKKLKIEIAASELFEVYESHNHSFKSEKEYRIVLATFLSAKESLEGSLSLNLSQLKTWMRRKKQAENKELEEQFSDRTKNYEKRTEKFEVVINGLEKVIEKIKKASPEQTSTS